jgi:response regulator of citrate/malate metabolism
VESDKIFTCLIIEDDPTFSEVLQTIIKNIPNLKLLGMVNNSVNGALTIAKEKPDLLFLDINISGLDGPEILEASDFKPKTIVISSHPESIMSDYEIKYNHYIQKPIKSASEFIESVKKVLES